MVNYRVNALWPWLSFEPSEGASGPGLGANGTGPIGIHLMAGAYDPADQAAMLAPGGSEVGLSNWRPVTANPFAQNVMPPAPPGQEPQLSWFAAQGNDELARAELKWPWLRVEPPDGSPTVGVNSNGTGPTGIRLMAGAYDPVGQAAVPALSGKEVGLSNWRSPNANPLAQNVIPPASPEVEPQTSGLGAQSSNEEVRPELKWPWLGVEAEDEPTGFPAAPGGSIASAPTRSANAFGADWRRQDFDRAGLFGGNEFPPFMGQPSEALETRPWWSRLPVQSEGSDDHPEPRWSWLRAEPEDEPPGFRLNPDGSINQPEPNGNIRLMKGAYDPPVEDVTAATARGSAENSTDVPRLPADGSQQAPVVAGTTATAVAVPAWRTAGSQTIRTALAELATLLGRGAAALPRISPASLALSFLVPTNTPSESIDLGNGLRARIRPGQRTVEIERQADGGLFGFGGRWETLPINAELSVGADGAPSVLIDRRQLENAVGPEAALQALDAIGSAMARPPKKRKEDEAQPPADTASTSNQTPNPGGRQKPPLGPGPLTTAVEVGSQVLEHANRPRSDEQEQAQLIEGWRQILKPREDHAPDGQYRGEGRFETALGVRMPPDVGDPAAGRDAYPEQEHLRKALIGEFELVNRIKSVRPDEIILRYGNAPGVQGPDVLSVGRDRLINIWDSKSRSAARSVGPSMAASPGLDQEHVWALILKAISEGRLSREVGLEALKNFYDGNYNILTVGTGNAHDGLVEVVRNHKSSGPRRH